VALASAARSGAASLIDSDGQKVVRVRETKRAGLEKALPHQKATAHFHSTGRSPDTPVAIERNRLIGTKSVSPLARASGQGR
jgi:hypothetical protein